MSEFIKTIRELVPWAASLHPIPKVLVSLVAIGATAFLLALVWFPSRPQVALAGAKNDESHANAEMASAAVLTSTNGTPRPPSLRSMLSANASLDKLRTFLVDREVMKSYLPYCRAELTVLSNFQIASYVFDFAILCVQPAVSQTADEVVYVKLMTPSLSATSSPVSKERSELLKRCDKSGVPLMRRDELRAALKAREDFRKHEPSGVDQSIVIVAGRRENTTKSDLEDLKRFNATHASIEIITWDSLAERCDRDTVAQ